MSDQLPSGAVVIAGGSGFLGVSLAWHLANAGTPVVLLSRSKPRVQGPWRHFCWDARTLGDWKRVLDGAAGVVNLVGRTVDCVKTPDHRDEILRSRIEATRVLGEAMRAIAAPPPVWVQMSTAHIYGDPPTTWCDEDSPFGIGLAPFVGKAWEEAFHESALPSQRQVILRTSFVIGHDRGAGGGALNRLKFVTRLGLGGRVGSGQQGMSWIHQTDMNRLFEHALRDPRMQGAYIATAPNPVAQVQFMRTLRAAMRMPIGLPAFAWMVRLGAPLLLRTDPELALYGRYVVSKRLRDEGFEFRFPELAEALADLRRPPALPLPDRLALTPMLSAFWGQWPRPLATERANEPAPRDAHASPGVALASYLGTALGMAMFVSWLGVLLVVSAQYDADVALMFISRLLPYCFGCVVCAAFFWIALLTLPTLRARSAPALYSTAGVLGAVSVAVMCAIAEYARSADAGALDPPWILAMFLPLIVCASTGILYRFMLKRGFIEAAEPDTYGDGGGGAGSAFLPRPIPPVHPIRRGRMPLSGKLEA